MPKILVVEDNETSREMLARRLDRKGFAVVTAADGEQGYALAQSEPPDLILMDISLPGMDGWQVIELLKAEAATREVPLIILTAHALVNDRARADEIGCKDYFSKPVDFKQLLGTIDRLLMEKKPA
ncbi:MAG TPA: response regulator [Candidatus Dormibacteraeota bacterium]|nr:response regulator [Candidatus Dormibacteraeota bacterium]